MSNVNELPNIHECLHEAALETAQSHDDLVPSTYRIRKSMKPVAEQICEMNGTNLSAYIRKCIEKLVMDYQPQQIPPAGTEE